MNKTQGGKKMERKFTVVEEGERNLVIKAPTYEGIAEFFKVVDENPEIKNIVDYNSYSDISKTVDGYEMEIMFYTEEDKNKVLEVLS